MKRYGMKLIKVIIVFLLIGINVHSQSIISPNYGLKTPQTTEVVRVDFNEESTVVWLTITSDINNAYFCIDRNTWLIKPDGERLKILSLKGLAWCPATYRFKRPGETASFSLTFEATGVLPWFSVVEECVGGCMAVYGIVTDSDLNEQLNEAYALSDRGEDMAAYRIFEDIITRSDSLNLGIEGALYSNLIMLDRKMGRNETARSWYDRMMTSDVPFLRQYLDNLKQQGISY
jgi:hypothetical protein